MKTFVLLFAAIVTTIYPVMAQPSNNFYDLEANGLLEGTIKMSDLKGKYVLIVNVASKCGYTPQYEDLQQLSERYGDQLVVIGFPCNQFGKQEPGSASDIAEFCTSKYDVDFLLTEKVDVKGDDQHPVYQWITSQSLDGDPVDAPKWNFHKYLIDKEGHLIGSFKSGVNPMDAEITDLID